jgi:hypothetical protein
VRPSYKICPANLIKLAKGSPALLSSSYYSASSYPSRTISLEEANLLPGAVSPQRASAAKSPTLASSSLLSALHFDDLSKIVVVPPRARIHCSKAAAAATLRSPTKDTSRGERLQLQIFQRPFDQSSTSLRQSAGLQGGVGIRSFFALVYRARSLSLDKRF